MPDNLITQLFNELIEKFHLTYGAFNWNFVLGYDYQFITVMNHDQTWASIAYNAENNTILVTRGGITDFGLSYLSQFIHTWKKDIPVNVS